MENKRCSVDQRINGQRTYQRTTEVVPSSVILSPLQVICYEVDTGAHSFRIAGFQSIYILFCRFISRLKCELSVLLLYLLVLILSVNIAVKNFKMYLRKERLRFGLSVKGLVWQETCYAYVTWRIMFGMFSCSVLSICSAHDRWGITRGRHNVYCLVKSSPFVDPLSNRFINETTLILIFIISSSE